MTAKKTIFLLSVSKKFFQLDFYILDSISSLDLLSKIIYRLFVND